MKTPYTYIAIITFLKEIPEVPFQFRKVRISINVLSEIRAYRWEKISQIDKRTGTFISYSRVLIS